MKFEDLIGKYRGSRIGVLGSGPSLLDFKDEINSLCDVIIACNGALEVLNPSIHKVDFFIYGDRQSPEDIWFNTSTKFMGQEGPSIRLLPKFLLPYDYNVLKSSKLRSKLEVEYLDFLQKFSDYPWMYNYFNPDISNLDLENGIIFRYARFDEKEIHKNDGPLCMGATITGVANQLAYKLGASEINLFGCGFNNENGMNYAYDSKGGIGATLPEKRERMDIISRILIENGVIVNSFGETNLLVPNNIECVEKILF